MLLLAKKDEGLKDGDRLIVLGDEAEGLALKRAGTNYSAKSSPKPITLLFSYFKK